MLHKLQIIYSEAEETVHILGTLRNRPLLDLQDLAGICRNATFVDHMPQVSNLALCEGALGLFNLSVVVSEQLKHARDVLDVLRQGFTEDENIIKETYCTRIFSSQSWS